MRRVALAAFALGLACFGRASAGDVSGDPAAAQPQPAPVGESPLRAARERLLELRFEDALASIEVVLSRNDLDEALRVEALGLRLQVHAAEGRFKEAESDYESILALQPAYVPDKTLIPRKLVTALEKIRSARVGIIVVDLQPPEASLTVDGRRTVLGADGRLAALAGERMLRADLKGFDAIETAVVVRPSAEVAAAIHLQPNSRSVRVVTEVPDVLVTLDGTPQGKTRPPDPGAAAELLIEDLPPGEHTLELSKPCFASKTVTDMLAIDLLDRRPKVYGPFSMQPVRSTLRFEGGPDGAEAFIDGESVGVLPQPPLETCPGRRDVAVKLAGRTLYAERVDLEAGVTSTLQVLARPNVVLVGPSAWPESLSEIAGAANTLHILPPPEGAWDPSSLASWKSLALPADTDLAVAVQRSTEVHFFSPLLGSVERVEGSRWSFARPGFVRSVVGLRLADSQLWGSALVVDVLPDSAAAAAGIRAGDRIGAVAGVKVKNASEVRTEIARRQPGTALALDLVAPDGGTRRADCRLEASPAFFDPESWTGLLSVAAAWASTEAGRGSGLEPEAARASLARLLSIAGRHLEAASTWRSVAFGARRGVGGGTVDYCLGVELLALGSEREAREAFTRALTSASSAPDDEGWPVAPAAAEFLRLLGPPTGG